MTDGYYRTTIETIFENEETVVGLAASDSFDLMSAERKTLIFKATESGVLYIDFQEETDEEWEQVFAIGTTAGDMYVNTFKDVFPRSVRIRWQKTDPGEATITYCKIYSRI